MRMNSLKKFTGKGFPRTSIDGIEPPIINVIVPEQNLIRYSVRLQDIALLISQEVKSDPAGDLSSGVARLKTGIDKKSIQSLASIPIISKEDGSKVYLQDLAILEINKGLDAVALYRDGNRAVSIRIDRSDLGDAIKIQNDVEEAVEELQKTLPKNVKIELSGTRAEAISNRLNLLLKNGATGLFFVGILLFYFYH